MDQPIQNFDLILHLILDDTVEEDIQINKQLFL
jgi:hypothetical protein